MSRHRVDVGITGEDPFKRADDLHHLLPPADPPEPRPGPLSWGLDGRHKDVTLWIGIGKVPRSVMAKQDHAAYGRHRLSLVVAHQSQGFQIMAVEVAERCERLGSRSKVDRFRAEHRQELLVEALAPGETLQLLDQLCIGAVVGGAQPHIHAIGRPLRTMY